MPSELSENREVVRVAPGARLSRPALLLAFALMITVGLSVYALFPENIGGPPLPVRVTLEKEPVRATNGSIAVLTDVVKIESELDQPITNLAIIVNGHYWHTHSPPLGPRDTLTFPLELFTDKRSSRRFDPELQQVEKLVIGGQLPSKSRGVSKFEFTAESSH